MRFSIIIPCKKLQDAYNCYSHCRKLDHNDYEILVIPDILQGGVPAKKRDYGAKIAKGEILAFIDADAYPPVQWLKVAEKYITDYALGGAGILPPDATFKERITDKVYKSLPFNHRVKISKPMFVSEMPSCNLFVKKDRFWQVGGFNWEHLTGEDSFLCHKLGGCLYVPELFVYHKRREIYQPLMKQVSMYGLNRGKFVKAYLKTVWNYGKNFIKGIISAPRI